MIIAQKGGRRRYRREGVNKRTNLSRPEEAISSAYLAFLCPIVKVGWRSNASDRKMETHPEKRRPGQREGKKERERKVKKITRYNVVSLPKGNEGALNTGFKSGKAVKVLNRLTPLQKSQKLNTALLQRDLTVLPVPLPSTPT